MSTATLNAPAATDATPESSTDQGQASRLPIPVEAGYMLASPSKAHKTCPVTKDRHEHIDPTRLAVCSYGRRECRRLVVAKTPRMESMTLTKRPIISYVRVSTDKQGRSGLGLEAQTHAIDSYAKLNKGRILATYTEVESGKRKDRPQLAKALAHARRAKATLVIGKLDRLARNVHFVSGLMEAGVDFVACDNPTANKLTIHILAAVAEDEARRISQRTKDALAAAKARGVKLGSARPGHWRGREDARRRGAKAGGVAGGAAARALWAARTDDLYEQAMTVIRGVEQRRRTRGLKPATLQRLADVLNRVGLTTATGVEWNKVQVARLQAASRRRRSAAN